MTVWRVLALSIILIYSLLGCRKDLDPSWLEKNDTDKLADFTENVQLWEASAEGRAYEFTYRKVCFCSLGYHFVNVFVDEKGEVESVNYLDLNMQVVKDPSFSEDVKTMALLFAEIGDLLENELSDVSVEYDENFGYPLVLKIDNDIRMVDDEVEYVVDSFQFLSN